ncbi:glycine betaine ABC transporter substrate-binding protein, partial [Streptomyces sp. 4F14]|uniref:glycine betaine ABC transporter substrate-binding protein n=1 Tax=Streptomyces sp. 4F14 TaxID=3394380 RepID=UPI003A83F59B
GTIEEWLMAAEYVAQRGNLDIVLCERGIRTFETATRNTLDIAAVPLVQRLSHLPVIVDPSHSGGRRDLVLPLTRAALSKNTVQAADIFTADPAITKEGFVVLKDPKNLFGFA